MRERPPIRQPLLPRPEAEGKAGTSRNHIDNVLAKLGTKFETEYLYALLTVSKKWTYELSMTRIASWRHILETHVNRFALILQVHGTKPLDDLA